MKKPKQQTPPYKPRRFTDRAGRSWNIDVSADTIRRVKRHLDVQLLDAVDPDSDLCASLGTDAALLVDVLYVVCMPDCERRGVSDEDFGRALAGDAMEEAAEALLRACADFFSNPRRQAVHRLLDRGNQIRQTLTAAGLETANHPAFDAALQSFAATIAGPSATGSPAS